MRDQFYKGVHQSQQAALLTDQLEYGASVVAISNPRMLRPDNFSSRTFPTGSDPAAASRPLLWPQRGVRYTQLAPVETHPEITEQGDSSRTFDAASCSTLPANADAHSASDDPCMCVLLNKRDYYIPCHVFE